MGLINLLSTISILGKLIDHFVDKPNLVIDKNIRGTFGTGEWNGFYGILELPFRVSNIGKRATTINYLQFFILNNRKKKLTYGFQLNDIDKTLNPGETFKIELGKIIFIRSERNREYINSLMRELKNNPIRFMLSSVYEGNLTLEKLFAEVLVITPHKKWRFSIPLGRSGYIDDATFIGDFTRVEKLDKNFERVDWYELK